jgi:hypothetical protein
MSECWDLTDMSQFLFTHVVLQDGDEYSSAEVPDRLRSPEELVIPDSCFQKIPKEHIWPLLEDNLTICSDPERPDIYIKRPRLIWHDRSDNLGLSLLEESEDLRDSDEEQTQECGPIFWLYGRSWPDHGAVL